MPVKFSTGPHAKYTHWKYVQTRLVSLAGVTHQASRQTVFYTPDTLAVTVGDEITGELSCAPNARNPRDLDISISYKGPTDVQPTTMQYKMCVIRFSLADLAVPIAESVLLTSCQVLIDIFHLKILLSCYVWLYTYRPAPVIAPLPTHDPSTDTRTKTIGRWHFTPTGTK